MIEGERIKGDVWGLGERENKLVRAGANGRQEGLRGHSKVVLCICQFNCSTV